ncbi:MAG: redoxin family protein [Phycisphaerales bacterium]|jgi:peroxiredoxin|nr:redoxin family protein [Phycisphaerales bacterium]
MLRRNTFLASLGLVAAAGLVAVATAMPVTPTAPLTAAAAKIGEKAPAFKLKDLDGKEHSLSDFKGKTVVIEWFSSKCPWSGSKSRNSIHSSGQVSTLMTGLKKADKDVVYVAIDSTARGMTMDAVVAADKKAVKSLKIKNPVLVDFDGKVGKMYGAKTTPHMFVIDGEGVLRYSGAFSDRADKNYVLDAVTAIKNGSTVSPTETRPYGCGVKYSGR